MSDLETMIQMFTKSEISFWRMHANDEESLHSYGGYAGFVSVLSFDTDGNLIRVEAFEE